jgi:4,5-DOPA dioxygenase extradiol
MTETMPAIFIGHGNPMHAISDDDYTRAWKALGQSFSRPRAILAISAHWYVPYGAVTAMANPRTIHDFGGFPRELFEVSYPAPGSPELASRVASLLAPQPIALDEQWGLDHGTWSVLTHLFPGADIPVVQLSIDRSQPPGYHVEMGKRLALLREEGVLVLGSGNVVHNLQRYAWQNAAAQPFDWALRFDQTVRDLVRQGDTDRLASYRDLGADAQLSIPTPDHYLPLIYILGMRKAEDSVAFPVTGIEGGSLSMLTVRLG